MDWDIIFFFKLATPIYRWKTMTRIYVMTTTMYLIDSWMNTWIIFHKLKSKSLFITQAKDNYVRICIFLV